jgi:hypothetical protein
LCLKPFFECTYQIDLMLADNERRFTSSRRALDLNIVCGHFARPVIRI